MAATPDFVDLVSASVVTVGTTLGHPFTQSDFGRTFKANNSTEPTTPGATYIWCWAAR